MKGKKRLKKAEVIAHAKKQIAIYSKCADPESYLAVEAAKAALSFLEESNRKVFTVDEANALLNW